MYLSYTEYEAMGGTLDSSAFSAAERRAEYLINAQTGGLTGARIRNLPDIPQAVKDCVFDLIGCLSENVMGGRQISSESQSQGGASESVSYVTKSDAEIEAQAENIVRERLYGGGCGHLLYRGARL